MHQDPNVQYSSSIVLVAIVSTMARCHVNQIHQHTMLKFVIQEAAAAAGKFSSLARGWPNCAQEYSNKTQQIQHSTKELFLEYSV